MTSPRRTVAQAIREALLIGEPTAKVFAARQVARDWRLGRLACEFDVAMPDRPAWPASLELLPPSQMPKRGKMGSQRNRIALWHALAHIEFAAIDLALDMAGRFGAAMERAFVDDFLSVAADEAMHFADTELCRSMTACGARRRIPLMTSLRDWRSCRWCWKRAGLMLPLPRSSVFARRGTKMARESCSESLTTKFVMSLSAPSIFMPFVPNATKNRENHGKSWSRCIFREC